MGCTIFWEAQEFSAVCQARCTGQLVAVAETAGWDYELAPEEFTAPIVDLNKPASEVRIVDRTLKLSGITLFPFGNDDEGTRPRLSFIFDNTNVRDIKARNRLVTLAPAPYWIEWMPRIRDQYTALSRESESQIYGVRFDGSMRVRRTEMPGFIKFLNTVRASVLPLLEIHSNDRQARKMISDVAGSLRMARAGQGVVEPTTLDELAEGLGTLFAAHRYDDWRLGLSTEEEMEREQARATRAVSRDRNTSDRGRSGRPRRDDFM
jgi:hypothetical protein